MMDDKEIERIVEENMPLAYFLAFRHPHIDTAEALSAAMDGLLTAAKNFNPERGIAFGTYAGMRIKWRLFRLAHDRKVIKRGGEYTFVSLHQTTGPNSDKELGEDIEDDCPAPFQATVDQELRAMVAKMINGLNRQQAFVISRRFRYGETLEEIGKRLKLTRERVRQIEFKALKELRKRLRKGDTELRRPLA